MAGYGRGGRGAALLQALNAPVRRPGQDNGSTENGTSTVVASVAQTASPAAGSAQTTTPRPTPAAAPVPMGRGAMLQMLLAKKAEEDQRAAGGGGAAIAPAASGAAIQTSPPQSTPLGRGFGRGLTVAPRLDAVPTSAVQPTTTPSPQPQIPMARGRALSSRPQESAASPGATLTPSPPVATQPHVTVRAEPQRGGADGELVRKSRIQRDLDNMTLETPKQKERGTSGVPLPLTANYLQIKTSNKEGVYHYHVAFDPPLDSIGIRKDLVRGLADLPKPFEFDGSSMFMPILLPPDGRYTCHVTSGPRQYRILIEMVRIVPYAHLTQFFNIMFHRIMKELQMSPIGRMYYDSHSPTHIHQHKMEVWPGFVTSIRDYDGGLMCMVDTTHKVLRTETVLDIMQDCATRSPQNFRHDVSKVLIGCSVLTRYNNRTYRIDDIDWDQTPMSTFDTRNGPVSYMDYYRQHYQKEVHDKQQPLLIHRPTKREQRESRGRPLEQICLIPELCYMTGLTDEARADFRIMKDLATHTRISPTQRQQRLREFAENVNSHPQARQVLASWGLELATNSLQLKGRQLNQERITLGNNKVVYGGDRAEWSNDCTRNAVVDPKDLHTWLVVCTQRNQQDVGNFLSHVENAYQTMGARIRRPILRVIPNDRTESYLNEIKRNFSDQLQLVMTVFPTSRDDRYNAIKKLCYCERPVASQVIMSRTISRRDRVRSVAQKVALQMNCKLGGGLWAISIPVDGVMIVGIDSYHDRRGDNSWGGFVASLDQGCTRWYSRVCRQLPGQELVDGLRICMAKAIDRFYEENGKPPSRIIIFRDGVGDGDLKYVREHEVAQFAATFPNFGEGYQPRMAHIVVQKRINTKLYSVMGNPARPKVDNPGPGTVVDHSVTRRELMDFFLVSQFVRQGTVKPTHYVVVHDDSGWTINKLQHLSYKMTHMYYNWPGTISAPAPCQYAHKLAYMVGDSLKKEPDPALSSHLFYL